MIEGHLAVLGEAHSHVRLGQSLSPTEKMEVLGVERAVQIWCLQREETRARLEVVEAYHKAQSNRDNILLHSFRPTQRPQ